MNENAMKALSELANKLGTTSEYLWSVLVQMAFFDGIIDLFIMVCMICASFYTYKKSKVYLFDTTDKYGRIKQFSITCWSANLFLWVFVFLFCSLKIKNVLTALVSPEYWALMKIFEVL